MNACKQADYAMKSILPTATFVKSWLFPATQREALLAYACRFDRPFWAQFTVAHDTRTVHLPSYAGGVLITETLQEHGPEGYRYTMTGVPNVRDYQGWFTVEAAGPEQVRLTWKIAFGYQRGTKALVAVAKVFARTAPVMTKALRQQMSH